MNGIIAVIPVEKIIDLIMENLEKGGVITADEKMSYRKTVETMSGDELIETLVESTKIREQMKALSN